jgi:hypothetical protein
LFLDGMRVNELSDVHLPFVAFWLICFIVFDFLVSRFFDDVKVDYLTALVNRQFW